MYFLNMYTSYEKMIFLYNSIKYNSYKQMADGDLYTISLDKIIDTNIFKGDFEFIKCMDKKEILKLKPIIDEYCDDHEYPITKYISKELLSDKEYLLELAKVYMDISAERKFTKLLVDDYLEYHDYCHSIGYLKETACDREFCYNIDTELLDDFHFVIKMHEYMPHVLRHIGPTLSSSEDFYNYVLDTFPGDSNFYCFLQEANENIKDNYNIVKKIILESSSQILYASDRLRNDPELALISIDDFYMNAYNIGDDLLLDDDFADRVDNELDKNCYETLMIARKQFNILKK